jgi:hypothetical protein
MMKNTDNRKFEKRRTPCALELGTFNQSLRLPCSSFMKHFSIQPFAFSLGGRPQPYSALFSVVQHYSALKKIFFYFWNQSTRG